jgi:large subunit ribosomal protein L4
VVFGPVPRSYGHSVPKKVRAGALRSALSAKAGADALVVVEELAIEPAKTKRAAEILGNLGVAEGKVLVVVDERDDAVERATRNLPRVRTLRAAGLNVYDVLWADRLVLTRAALERVEERLARKKGAEA